jgi:carbonic anhydrase/acetyltransferase-like protein (isoleucine patch superfamily)
MTNFQIVLINEKVHGSFPGYRRDFVLTELPIWADFRVNDIMHISNIGEVPLTYAALEDDASLDVFLATLKKKNSEENIVLGRTGNVVVLDWPSLFSRMSNPKSIRKIQVGKVPSEYYCMKKTDLISIMEGIARPVLRNSAVRHLFEGVLFSSFESIVDIEGFSFLIRNALEYYRENLKTGVHLRQSGFLEVYGAMRPVSTSQIVIGEDAVVKNSILGNGAKVNGMIEDSVIFNGVSIGRNAYVNSSVILPPSVVEDGVAIENALVLGGEGAVIKRGSVVGGKTLVINKRFPDILKNGLTVVGEGTSVPRESRIGSGCLVYGKNERNQQPLNVPAGETVMTG